MSLDITKVDLTSKNQKAFAVILLGIVLGLAYYLLPPFIVFVKNIWIALMYSVPLIFLTIFAIANPMLLWNISKQLSWNITKALIKQDKIGYMYRYHDYILLKIQGIEKNAENLMQIRIELEREVATLTDTINNHKKQASAIIRSNGSKELLNSTAAKIEIDTRQLEKLLPEVKRIQLQEESLIKMSTTMTAEAENLKYRLDATKREYDRNKLTAKATKHATELLGSNTEQHKIYQESLKQIELEVTQYIATINNFERKAKPILESADISQSISEQRGLELVEEFMKNSGTLKEQPIKLIS